MSVMTGTGLLAERPGATAPRLQPILTSEERRVLDEWSTGVDPCDLIGLTTLFRHGRAVPSSRIAFRCGSEVLTYGELFDALDRGEPPSHSGEPSSADVISQLAAMRNAIGDAAVPLGARGLLLGLDALAVAVADRRCVAADRKLRRFDPALRPRDVRLIALPWGDPQVAADLLAAVAHGATVVMPTVAQRGDAAALGELIATHAATQVISDAGLPLRLAATDGVRLDSVQRWDLAGTDWAETLPELVRSVSPDAVSTFAYRSPAYLGAVARGPLVSGGWVRPVPGAKVLVLDASRRPVLPGAAGDVYVGGRVLADGFADGADEERFVADPFEPQGRLYRTGDRARWAQGGRLVVEGRQW